MKLFDLLKNIDYTLAQGKDTEVTGIAIDSRKVNEGDLFICIDGLNVDGHRFIPDVFSKGASAVLVDKDIEDDFKGMAVVKVTDTRAAMSIIAGNMYSWPSKSFPLIGVTGTNGKTSTTYFLEAVFKKANHKTGVIGTVSTRVGDTPVKTSFATSTTPDPLELQQIFVEMKDIGVDEVVMEVSSHALWLHKIDGLCFKTAIFTNLTQDHLDLHGSMENYMRAKAKLFGITDISIINIDDPYGEEMLKASKGKVITYSIEKKSDLMAENINYTSQGVSFDLNLEKCVSFEIPIPGRFTVYNALGVIGAALNMCIPLATIQMALKELKGVPGRIQSIPNTRGIGVYVDYAHSPDSLENIITAVREFTDGKIYVVFGCGGDRDKLKRPIMGDVVARLGDFAVVTSDNPRTEDPQTILDEIEAGVKPTGKPYIKIIDRAEAIEYAIKSAVNGDSVIIAGKGHEDYQIFADRTIHFDDAEEAKKVIEG
ncbi:MAG: UDP-N-acetylmuramoyl-L-alanyl-D-glutamate--2,6-diaminopimelate ligase [Clostridiales bacterium]|jgi:UDP-N-acetylmuramyl-tripeptide synthetase|nr:UDP-N-acetylmuramoyl-L-alanyl-D-glutamate--2,6-diaminopimelate ligase [Clostridiales bacterium]